MLVSHSSFLLHCYLLAVNYVDSLLEQVEVLHALCHADAVCCVDVECLAVSRDVVQSGKNLSECCLRLFAGLYCCDAIYMTVGVREICILVDEVANVSCYIADELAVTIDVVAGYLACAV